MLIRVEVNKGPHQCLFQINYVTDNGVEIMLGIKRYCGDVDSTTDYIAGIYQAHINPGDISTADMDIITQAGKEAYDAISSERF